MENGKKILQVTNYIRRRHQPNVNDDVPYFEYWRILASGGNPYGRLEQLSGNPICDLREPNSRGLFYLNLLYHHLSQILQEVREWTRSPYDYDQITLSGVYNGTRIRARYINPHERKELSRLFIVAVENNKEVEKASFKIDPSSEELMPIKRGGQSPNKLRDLLDEVEIEASRIMREQVRATLPGFRFT